MSVAKSPERQAAIARLNQRITEVNALAEQRYAEALLEYQKKPIFSCDEKIAHVVNVDVVMDYLRRSPYKYVTYVLKCTTSPHIWKTDIWLEPQPIHKIKSISDHDSVIEESVENEIQCLVLQLEKETFLPRFNTVNAYLKGVFEVYIRQVDYEDLRRRNATLMEIVSYLEKK